MEIIALIIPLLNLVVGIFVIVAILRLFTISKTLKDILQKLTELGALEIEIDQHRRDEFNALAESQSVQS